MSTAGTSSAFSDRASTDSTPCSTPGGLSSFKNANIKEVVEQLTTDEAISLIAGVGFWSTAAIQRLGIPSIKVSEHKSLNQCNALTLLISFRSPMVSESRPLRRGVVVKCLRSRSQRRSRRTFLQRYTG